MSDILSDLEVTGLRQDFFELLGIGNLVTPNPHTTVRIQRITSKGTLNTSTGRYSGETRSNIYDPVTHPTLYGAAYLTPILTQRSRQELAAGEQFRSRAYRLLLPYVDVDFWLSDICVVLSCRDPNVVGREFRVTDVLYESDLAARRLTLIDDTVDGLGSC